MMSIRWEKPCSEWLKLNTDGLSLGNPGLTGGGGLIRDDNGDWVVGFARKIGFASSFMAELWALSGWTPPMSSNPCPSSHSRDGFQSYC